MEIETAWQQILLWFSKLGWTEIRGGYTHFAREYGGLKRICLNLCLDWQQGLSGLRSAARKRFGRSAIRANALRIKLAATGGAKHTAFPAETISVILSYLYAGEEN